MDIQNNTTLIIPRTINELITAIAKNPKAEIFAGGTYLMSRDNYYSSNNFHTYIALHKIPELHRVLHADKFVEFGSMVTIQQVLNLCSASFPSDLYSAIDSIGTSILKNQMTLGGALSTPFHRFALCTILCAVKAQVELKVITGFGIFKDVKQYTKWLTVDKLYSKDGKFLYNKNAVITKIRIPYDSNQTLIFRSIGSLLQNSDNSVVMAVQYTSGQEMVVSSDFCLSFVKNGLFINPGFNEILHSLKFPVSAKAIQKISTDLKKVLKTDCPKISILQAERARYITLSALIDANNRYISGKI